MRFLFLLWLSACATSTGFTDKLTNRYLGRVMELRYSCYYGALYDENEKLLLTPYPFANTYHLVDLAGKPIHPKQQKGMIKAGSRFAISNIEFPSYKTMLTRMVTTPRENIWVYLRAVPTEKIPLRSDRPFVLVLPLKLDTEQKVTEALNSILAPEGEMLTWLESLRPAIRAAIETKTVVPGMHKEEMLAALGPPLHWFNDTNARVAWYPTEEIWLSEESVIKTLKPRTLAKQLTEPQKLSR